jgi:hypothetical protein
MPWYLVRTKEVWDATHVVEAADEEAAIQFVIEGHSEGVSEFGYLIESETTSSARRPSCRLRGTLREEGK